MSEQHESATSGPGAERAPYAAAPIGAPDQAGGHGPEVSPPAQPEPAPAQPGAQEPASGRPEEPASAGQPFGWATSHTQPMASPGYGPGQPPGPGYGPGTAPGIPAGSVYHPGYAWGYSSGYGPGYAPAGPSPLTSRRSGWRIGLAGLVAGALIGGGAGAGVVALVDSPSGPATTGAAAQNVVIKNPETATTATAAAAKAAPSVVTIYVTSGSGAGSGSGVVLSQDGYVLTNNHVVTLDSNRTGTVQVRTANGTLYNATVVGTDPTSDLAVVKLDGAKGLTPAAFADSTKVQVGDVAVAIGAPLGLSNTVTDGIISAIGRAVTTGSTQNDATVIDAIQTDAAINPGNSGGALVNGAGEVIGINTAIATVASGGFPGQQSESGNIGVGFAIPSNTATRIAQEIIKTGSATRAVLGVSAATEGSDNSPVSTGARIVQVQQGGAAEKAGLQAGDIITAVGDRPVTTSAELTAAVRSKSPGDKVTLSVRRGNTTQKVDVTLGSSS